MNRIFGGSRGNSGGKLSRALKNPPSLDEMKGLGCHFYWGGLQHILESIRGSERHHDEPDTGLESAKYSPNDEDLPFI
jgi:hypothetical protein